MHLTGPICRALPPTGCTATCGNAGVKTTTRTCISSAGQAVDAYLCGNCKTSSAPCPAVAACLQTTLEPTVSAYVRVRTDQLCGLQRFVCCVLRSRSKCVLALFACTGPCLSRSLHFPFCSVLDLSHFGQIRPSHSHLVNLQLCACICERIGMSMFLCRCILKCVG